MSQGYLEIREQELKQELERLSEKLEDQQAVVVFEEFQHLENLFDEDFNTIYIKYFQRYEDMALKYLRNVIANSKKNCKDEKTSREYSYFFQESLKIINTQYFPFYNSLKELNFLDFIWKLQTDIKQSLIHNENASGSLLMNKYQQLISKHNLCSIECVGCNGFFYQFHSIELNLRKRNYEIHFLHDSSKIKQTALKLTETVNSKYGDWVNLLELQEEKQLLKLITQFLNKSGGFILIGCKRVQQFESVKHAYTFEQLNFNYMDAHFVVGESINQQKKIRIRQGLQKLIKKISPVIQMDKNITLSFLPVKPTPFQLGFGLQEIELDSKSFQENHLNLVLIKIHPTKPKYDYILNPNSLVCFEELDDFPSIQVSQRSSAVEQYLKALQQGLDGEDMLRQQFSLETRRSYFDDHKCKALPYLA